MSVHEIKRASLMNVPEKLRELATEFERQSDALRTAVVIVGYANGTVAVRGFGERTSALEATGWLHRALDVLTNGAGAFDNLTPQPKDGA